MTQDINILDLLALVEIFDKYEEFEKDLTKLLSNKRSSTETIAKIRMLANGEKGHYPKSVRTFYEKHKEAIHAINRYESIQSFMYHQYDYDKETKIYKYLNSHKEELKQIKAVLLKLKELGVDRIELDENFNFKEKKYYMYTWMSDNTSIHFVDNIEAIPEYPCGRVLYQTTSSPYEIKFNMSFGMLSDKYNRVKVNSLTFDKDRLPNKVSKDEIIDTILEAREDKKDDYERIRNIIDLKEVQEILEYKLKKLEEILSKVDSLSDKQTVIDSLKSIKQELENIKEEIEKYEREAMFESTYITEEVIKKEEEAYQRRKRESECHIW